jgi:glycogen debranching enzyme
MTANNIAHTATAEIDTIAETPFYVPATGSAMRPRCTLKYDDTFVVLDNHGDIGASAGGPDGLFHNDTRFLSRLELLVNGLEPLLLGFNVRDDNTLITFDLTNPDIYRNDHVVLQKDTLHVVRTIFLRRNCIYQRLAVHNHGDRPIDMQLTVNFDNDFADLFEVRGTRRRRRGVVLSEHTSRSSSSPNAINRASNRASGGRRPSCPDCAPSTASAAMQGAELRQSRRRIKSSTRCCVSRWPISIC